MSKTRNGKIFSVSAEMKTFTARLLFPVDSGYSLIETFVFLKDAARSPEMTKEQRIGGSLSGLLFYRGRARLGLSCYGLCVSFTYNYDNN